MEQLLVSSLLSGRQTETAGSGRQGGFSAEFKPAWTGIIFACLTKKFVLSFQDLTYLIS